MQASPTLALAKQKLANNDPIPELHRGRTQRLSIPLVTIAEV